MNDGFIHWDLERKRFFYGYKNMLDNFERNLLNFRHMYDPFNGVGNGLLNWNRNFFDDRNDNSLRYWHMNRNGMRHRNDNGLIDFELYVLGQRDDDLFVVFDRFRVLFFHVLVDGVDVGLQVVAAVVTAAVVTA